MREKENSSQLQKPRISWCQLLPVAGPGNGCHQPSPRTCLSLEEGTSLTSQEAAFSSVSLSLLREDGRGKGCVSANLKKKKECAHIHLRILCELSRCKSLLKMRLVGTFDLLLQPCNALHLDKRLCLELELEKTISD